MFKISELAYLAGVIDCDGFITVQRYKSKNKGKAKPNIYHGIKVGISGTRREPHDFAASLFGGNVCTYRPKNPNHRVQHQWSATGPTAAKFLIAIKGHLRIKGAQADLALLFQETIESHRRAQKREQKPPYRITDGMHQRRDELWIEMKNLNQARN